MASYANPEVLVETDWLEQHLAEPDLRIIEVDEDTSVYRTGHIPNAVAWDWFEDLHTDVGRDYVDQDGLARLLGEAGVGPDTTVVLYGGSDNWFAAYAYWLLTYLGFDRAKLLNGGRKKWEAEGRGFTAEAPSFASTDLRIEGPFRKDLRAFRDEVLDGIGRASFVDVRSPEEYRGEKLAPDHLPQEQSQVPGHIPGAASIPWAQAVNEDGTFRSADELRELYASKGVTDEGQVIAYCRIGERSSHTWFALRELLGFRDVKNYDGSWTEYGSLVGVPVELG